MNSFLVKITDADVYLKDKKILSAINWTVEAGESWAVVGNNGSGKTTLMKLVFGELLPINGEGALWFGSAEWNGLGEVREKIGMVSAEYQANYDKNISGREVVESGFFSSIGLYDRVAEKQGREAREWMEYLGIGHLEKKDFYAMSYGEARRVILARALVNRPLLLVLDEPCAGLDIPTRELLLETLEKLSTEDGPSGKKTHLIYVTHHIDEILPSITHVLLLKDGEIFSKGHKQEMLTDKTLSQTLNCDITLEKNRGRYWVTSARSRKK